MDLTQHQDTHDDWMVSAFRDSPVAQVLLDLDGAVVEANDAFCRLVGRGRADVVGQRPAALAHTSDSGEGEQQLARLMSAEVSSVQYERIMAHASGRPLPLLVRAGLVTGADGRPQGIAAHYQDLTVLRDSERRLEQVERFYAALGQRSHDAAIVTAPDGAMVYISPSVTGLFGYSPEELLDQEGSGFLHPDDAAQVAAVRAQVVSNGGVATASFRVRTRDGDFVWVDSTITNLIDTPIGGVVSNLVDVTQRREAEQAVQSLGDRYRAVVEAASEGIWLTDPEGRTELVNRQMAEVLGLPLSALEGADPLQLLGERGDALLDVRRGFRRAAGRTKYELDYAHPDGSTRQLVVTVVPLSVRDESFYGSLVMVRDVTSERRTEQELRGAALQDSLTGLASRLLLTERLEQLGQLPWRSSTALGLLFLDVHDFKRVNEAYGHEVGDAVLVELARRLREAALPVDTVARVGDDEFAVLMSAEDEAAVEARADGVRAALAPTVVVGGERLDLRLAAGFADTRATEPAELLRFAETAMFAAKSAAPSAYRRFDAGLAEELRERYSLLSELRRAVADERLEMRYQPVVDLASGAVLGLEALARWRHPEHGDVPAEVFMPLVLETGLSQQFDTRAIRRCAEDFAALRAAGGALGEGQLALKLCVVSPEGDFERRLLSQMARVGVPATQVVLEVTEQAVVADLRRARPLLARLVGAGFGVVLDQFGAGQSSLANLRDVTVTGLKVDRRLVRDLGEDSDALAIVAAIVQLGRAIGVAVYAPGVETEEQAALLRQLGCTAAQGKLWSDAVSPGSLRHLPIRYRPASLSPPRHPRRRAADVTEEHGLVRMVELQRQGASWTTIAAALNSEGFTAPNGARWHKMAVARALANLASLAPAVDGAGPLAGRGS